MSNDKSTNETPRSSQITTLTPTWGPPRAPLAPHRLAKLANALGVSTPIPAIHHVPLMSTSYTSSSGSLDPFRRSPTPSMTSSNNLNAYSPTTSRYLLHVIPPLSLPHESELFDNFELTPPPSSASGYHTQFRRGTLVPVHATLQSQLGAIAKEYALPSTSGLILYLVSSPRQRDTLKSPAPVMGPGDEDEPGPRLSEDIWKHLWVRVLKEEQRDDNMLLPSRSTTPNIYTSNGIGAQSSPLLTQESTSQPLRPLISTSGLDTSQSLPIGPRNSSPSTPSSISDMPKSAPHSSSSISLSEAETPDTSQGAVSRANSLDLPGLHSPSIVPILAKVEFDIDRRRAGWFEPWLRSRKMNQAKRSESRNGRQSSMSEVVGGEEVKEKKGPIDLLTVKKHAVTSISLTPSRSVESVEVISLELGTSGYEPLSESIDDAESERNDFTDEEAAEEEEEDLEEDLTAQLSVAGAKGDPLDEVFGSDSDTWAEMHESHRDIKHQSNPNVVELALTGADLAALPSVGDDHEEFDSMKEAEEVENLLEQMSRPQLSISIPPSPTTSSSKRLSSPTSHGSKKHIPPPLVLHSVSSGSGDLSLPEPSPMPSSAGTANLPYLDGSSSDEHPNQGPSAEYDDKEFNDSDDFASVRSPAEEKRSGVVFDELDLGLDPSEDFDDNDPHDRRRSQYLMRAQLDEIERTMAQFSPRMLKADLEEDPSMSFHSSTLSPNSSFSLSPNMHNPDFFPPSPKADQESAGHTLNRDSSGERPAWPAVTFASLREPTNISPSSDAADLPPSPPRLAVNGVTTSAPRSFMQNVRTSSDISPETEKRKRELEEEQALYLPSTQAVSRPSGPSTDSPVIPLSPDPFGRYPSTPDVDGNSRQSAYWDSVHMSNSSAIDDMRDGRPSSGAPVANMHSRGHSTATSRFSADSLGEELSKAPTRSTLMTVKTIKKLWRKSNKNSVSGIPQTPATQTQTVGRTSTQLPPPRPERPSQEVLDLPPMTSHPTTPTFGRFSPQLPQSERPSQEQLSSSQLQQLSVPFGAGRSPSPIIAAQMQQGSNLDRLHFDQESPYPTRRSPPVRHAPQPPPPPPISAINEKEKNSVRKSILKSWKSASGIGSQSTNGEGRASLERPNAQGGRSRRPSVLNFGSARTSASSPPPDIPPSPQIPEHFVGSRNGAPPSDLRQLAKSKVGPSSIESAQSPPTTEQPALPRRSVASSRDSEETRPSLDVSQFEIVSPKMNKTLSYPYHGLDNDSSIG